MADFIFDPAEMEEIASALRARGEQFSQMLVIYERCMKEISHTGFAEGKTSESLRAFPGRVRIAEKRISEAYKIIADNLLAMGKEVQQADKFSF